ncbi:SDR family NAD(P)-dependent oxidoreductase [Dysgonomonas sp. Marseille-P4677]|uniref:SDR family NAD(P)-dependent oxidoreductase n=1 Tax=Dysgonomonas sp. Marseille-P4677 TaxID=2364790 RepID=UPI0019114254|nr:SDR family NAD(P)-dependent oxidoreductase [Dysgonomonas sp. Marseille-P4677]MBK5722434.1 SDR family NAD(P)-dependent oxidoreductase [Dysgonomonas sp. Marseille-P4677]
MGYSKDIVVWITGASSGLGEALAVEFGRQGAKIILSGRNMESLESVQSKISDSRIVAFDISDPSILKEKVDEAIAAYGHIDIVIHNAGIAQSSTAFDTESDVENKILQVDYFSPIQLSKYLLPHFMERKSGHIVAVSGLLAYLNLSGRSTYAGAKAALNAYFGCLRAEVKPLNINVTVLIPGSLSTNLVNKALTGDGNIVKNKRDVQGYPLDKAAKKIVSAISKKKYQTYVGSKKEFIMWKLHGLYPNFVIKQILNR